VIVDGVKVGYVSVPHPVVLSGVDKKCAVAFFEISTEKFAAVNPGANAYVEHSKFLAIDIDTTFVADIASVSLPEVAKVAKAASDGLLSDVRMKDIYTDADGVNALTLRFSYVSNDRTLSKQELQPTTDAVALALESLGLKVKA